MISAVILHIITKYLSFQCLPQQVEMAILTTVAAITPDGAKEDCAFSSSDLCICRYRYFFKSTTAPDCSRDFRSDGEIHLSCRLEDRELVTGEYFCHETVKLEEKALKTVKSSIQDITEGEEDECEQFMYALILSGLAMQMIGNSRPASCAEHQVTHLWDMEVINGPLDALHGEKVSVAALLVLEEYKRIAAAITQGRCHAKPYENEDEELLKRTFGKKGLLEEIRKENEPELLETISPQHLEKCRTG